MNRPKCDGFVTWNDQECILKVYETEDGYVTDYSIEPLHEDGTEGTPFEIIDDDAETAQLMADEIYRGWLENDTGIELLKYMQIDLEGGL